jgi:hypothetical protein
MLYKTVPGYCTVLIQRLLYCITQYRINTSLHCKTPVALIQDQRQAGINTQHLYEYSAKHR